MNIFYVVIYIIIFPCSVLPTPGGLGILMKIYNIFTSQCDGEMSTRNLNKPSFLMTNTPVVKFILIVSSVLVTESANVASYLDILPANLLTV